jgi:uncharacterized protein YqcC (DUF446 family)
MKDRDKNGVPYAKAQSLALEIEAELKRLGRWRAEPLSPQKFENMGAFGENTMCFEEWLQFVLIPRIKEITTAGDDLPAGSMLAPYAIRVFDGDTKTDQLHQLLYDLDALVNGDERDADNTVDHDSPPPSSFSIGEENIPPVLYTLAEVLPQFSGADLESQLQTFDTFLEMMSPAARVNISNLLLSAAEATADVSSRLRIEQAAKSILNGGRAAEPYDHEEAMKRYREEFKKNYRK